MLTTGRCDDFVFFCEDHRKFYLSSKMDVAGNFDSCCEAIFDPEPFFHNEGTCFSMKAEIREKFPALSSSVKVWLQVDERNAPGDKSTPNTCSSIELQTDLNLKFSIFSFFHRSPRFRRS